MAFDLSSLQGIYFPVTFTLPGGRTFLLPRFSSEVEKIFLAAWPPGTAIAPVPFARLFLGVLARVPAAGADLNGEKIDDAAYEQGAPIGPEEIGGWPAEWVEQAIETYLRTYAHVFLPHVAQGRTSPERDALAARAEGETATEHLKRLVDALFVRTQSEVEQRAARLRRAGMGAQVRAYEKENDLRSRELLSTIRHLDRMMAPGIPSASGPDLRIPLPPPAPGLDALKSIQREAAEQRRVQNEQAKAIVEMLEETRGQSEQLNALAGALRLLTEQTQRHEALFSGLLQEAKGSSAEAARSAWVAVVSLVIGALLSGASLYYSATSKSDDLLSVLAKTAAEQIEVLRSLDQRLPSREVSPPPATSPPGERAASVAPPAPPPDQPPPND